MFIKIMLLPLAVTIGAAIITSNVSIGFNIVKIIASVVSSVSLLFFLYGIIEWCMAFSAQDGRKTFIALKHIR